MKILIVSDSHGQTHLVDQAYKRFPNCDLYLHAGDLEDSPFAIFPFEVVRGNCDYDPNLNNERFLTSTPYGNLLMKHIPNLDKKELDKYDVKIFVYGHLHRRDFTYKDEIYYVSPGSIALERDKYENGFCLLEITPDSVKAEFYDI